MSHGRTAKKQLAHVCGLRRRVEFVTDQVAVVESRPAYRLARVVDDRVKSRQLRAQLRAEGFEGCEIPQIESHHLQPRRGSLLGRVAAVPVEAPSALRPSADSFSSVPFNSVQLIEFNSIHLQPCAPLAKVGQRGEAFRSVDGEPRPITACHSM